MAPSMNFASQKEYPRVLNHRWILSDGWHRWGAKIRTRRKARDMMKCEEGKSRDEIKSARICANCRTSKTPLWRSGPTGPKSLCNACGIKFRKRQIQYEAGETNSLSLTCSSDPELSFLTMEELKQLQKEKQQNALLLHARRRTEEIEKMKSGRELAEAALLLLAFSKGSLVIS